MTLAEMKATYDEIRNWIQENYGFHVINLNIANAKRKCGFTLWENYNLPKSENSRSSGTGNHGSVQTFRNDWNGLG